MPDLTVKCPTCDKAIRWTTENTFRPFCSERCKLIDLGEWASGNRFIPADPEYDANPEHNESTEQDLLAGREPD